ncbi:MAG: hypothetical protein FJZ58_03365 [Chlamydiae bacterium]|nr:hypothetical protein [Chlamydiota bacterium]
MVSPIRSSSFSSPIKENYLSSSSPKQLQDAYGRVMQDQVSKIQVSVILKWAFCKKMAPLSFILLEKTNPMVLTEWVLLPKLLLRCSL